jgi:hypothetical protein
MSGGLQTARIIEWGLYPTSAMKWGIAMKTAVIRDANPSNPGWVIKVEGNSRYERTYVRNHWVRFDGNIIQNNQALLDAKEVRAARKAFETREAELVARGSLEEES